MKFKTYYKSRKWTKSSIIDTNKILIRDLKNKHNVIIFYISLYQLKNKLKKMITTHKMLLWAWMITKMGRIQERLTTTLLPPDLDYISSSKLWTVPPLDMMSFIRTYWGTSEGSSSTTSMRQLTILEWRGAKSKMYSRSALLSTFKIGGSRPLLRREA